MPTSTLSFRPLNPEPVTVPIPDPGYETPSIFAVICDNYFIEAGGPGACLHKTPKQVFEV